MRIATLGTLLSLIFFVGCVRIPEDEMCCMLDETPSIEKTIQEGLASGAFEEGDFPAQDWWEMFQDEQLSLLICKGLEKNPTLQAAEARVSAAEEEAIVTRSRLFPSIGLNAIFNWRYLGKNNFFRAFGPAIPADIKEYILNLDFTYEFDFWNKNQNRYRASLGVAQAQEAEKQQAILMLSTSIATTYFRLQAIQEKRRVLKEERENFVRLLGLTGLRKRNALDNTSEILAAEEHLFAVNKNILFTEEQIALTKHQLNLLLGEGPEENEEIERIKMRTSFDFPLPSSISSDLLSRRPDLMAQIWLVETTAYLVGAAKADFYPRIDLLAFGGLDSVFFSKIFTPNSLMTQLIPALHLPIFTAGRIKANLKAREAEFHENIYIYNDMVLRAVKEVADQIVTLQKKGETLDVENLLLETKVKDHNLMALRYQNSLVDLLSVLDTQNKVFQEQFRKITIEYEKVVAAIELIRALGGGYCYD